MLASPLSPFFLDTYFVSLCHLSNIRPCASSYTFLSSGWFFWILPWSILRMVSNILQEVLLGVYSIDEISAAELVFQKFSFSSEVLFSYFFLWSPLFYGDRFQYSLVHVIFLFSKHSGSFLIWQFYSFCYFSSPFLLLAGHFFSLKNSIPISWLYILIVCIWVSHSFSFLGNSLMSSLYIRWLIFSSDLLNL